LSLSNLYQGAAIERFVHELQRVVDNIKDVNTDAEAKRKITLEVTFSPYSDRTGIEIEVNCKSTIAATAKLTDQTVFIMNLDGRPTAFTHDPRQQDLFSPPAKTDDNRVVPMKGA
jgi:hypothetical protein